MNDLDYYQSVIDDYVAQRARREESAEFRAAIAIMAAYAVAAFALGFWTLALIGMGG